MKIATYVLHFTFFSIPRWNVEYISCILLKKEEKEINASNITKYGLIAQEGRTHEDPAQ